MGCCLSNKVDDKETILKKDSNKSKSSRQQLTLDDLTEEWKTLISTLNSNQELTSMILRVRLIVAYRFVRVTPTCIKSCVLELALNVSRLVAMPRDSIIVLGLGSLRRIIGGMRLSVMGNGSLSIRLGVLVLSLMISS